MRILKSCSNLFVTSLALVIVLTSFSCTSAAKSVNADRDGVAIKGYDPVAYFTVGKPMKGLNQLAFQWNGATWLFSSREHLDLFSADPDQYAPQYGGY